MSFTRFETQLPASGYRSTETQMFRTPFEGGLNKETPPLQTPPGFVSDAMNFEIDIDGGYRRILGYERFDGRPSPSAADVFYLPAVIVSADPPVPIDGVAITGKDSGASAYVVKALDSGLMVTKVSGAFSDNEDILFDGNVVASTSGKMEIPLLSFKDKATYQALAADIYRMDIMPVPGSGPVRGIASFKDKVYAFRDAMDRQSVVMYRAGGQGWEAVPMGHYLHFEKGEQEIRVGNQLLNGRGGKLVVTGVAVTVGSFAFGNAEGTLTVKDADGWQKGDLLNIEGTKAAELVSDVLPVTLKPGGRFRFASGSIGGSIGHHRLYWVDGVNTAFEFDGVTLIPIYTGMVNDHPECLAIYRQHLFLSFGSSLQNSGLGDQYAFTPLLGASEIAIDGNITGLQALTGSQHGGALLVAARHKTYVLYGSSTADFNLVETESDAGAYPMTLQRAGFAYMLDDRGVRQFGSTEAYGNFAQSTVSNLIQSDLSRKTSMAVDSHVVRAKNQYRLFFNDGSAYFMTVDNNKVKGFMPVFYPNPVTCSISDELSDGSEVVFFGSSNGYVYQSEKGTSFDGQDIHFNLSLVPDYLQSPDMQKRFRKVSLEIKSESYVEFQFGYALNYNEFFVAKTAEQIGENMKPSFSWDKFQWDMFFWDNVSLNAVPITLEGSGPNIVYVISGTSFMLSSFQLTGLLTHYTVRKRRRSG